MDQGIFLRGFQTRDKNHERMTSLYLNLSKENKNLIQKIEIVYF